MWVKFPSLSRQISFSFCPVGVGVSVLGVYRTRAPPYRCRSSIGWADPNATKSNRIDINTHSSQQHRIWGWVNLPTISFFSSLVVHITGQLTHRSIPTCAPFFPLPKTGDGGRGDGDGSRHAAWLYACVCVWVKATFQTGLMREKI